MCGITGFVTNPKTTLTNEQVRQRDAIFRGMLIAMQTRGTDSTGVALINTESGDNLLFKRAKSALDFVGMADWEKKTGEGHHFNACIGHTRAATQGTVTDRNAHPFTYGDVIGAHNGSVSNWDEVADDDMEVDSEVIFKSLDKEEDPTKAFKDLRGWFAVSWYDKRSKKVQLVRHSNSFLKVWFVKSLDTMFWASEEGWGNWKNPSVWEILLVTNGIAKEDAIVYKTEDDRVYNFEENEEGEYTMWYHKTEFGVTPPISQRPKATTSTPRHASPPKNGKREDDIADRTVYYIA